MQYTVYHILNNKCSILTLMNCPLQPGFPSMIKDSTQTIETPMLPHSRQRIVPEFIEVFNETSEIATKSFKMIKE